MPLLEANTRQQVADELADLKEPVKLVVFTQAFECQYCTETRQLCEEVADLSDQISVEILNFVTDQEIAEEYSIDKIPAIAVSAQRITVCAFLASRRAMSLCRCWIASRPCRPVRSS